jgi:hypothetical protein
MTIFINQVGYLPRSAKFCVMGGTVGGVFRVLEAGTHRVIHQADLVPGGPDLGPYLLGDISALTGPGVYRVVCGGETSAVFRIAQEVYDEPIRKMVRCFSVQRCGASDTGYNRPCHLDDGRRSDNGKHQDVTGGWHDACDLRKWVGATIHGMIGLSRVAEMAPAAASLQEVAAELRWGNRYFLNMQEPAGCVMNHCGGDFARHADNNRWTDNVPDSPDDRVIDVRPCRPGGQFLFIQAQAAMDRLLRAEDPAFADRCRAAALRCLQWCLEKSVAVTAGDYSAAISACVELYRATDDETYADRAAAFARQLLALQVWEPIGAEAPIRGFFRMSAADPEPFKDIVMGGAPVIALADLLQHCAAHEDEPMWVQALEMLCEGYLAPMAARNAFGLVPFGLYHKQESGSPRRIGEYTYRYFMRPDPKWWVGINAHVAGTGVGLLAAARLLGRQELAALAQRQYDWVAGVNPFHASTAEDIGPNNPQHMVSTEFTPGTPRIPGAVMNGIGGTEQDQPFLGPGSYHTCEYWTPMLSYTMWLAAALRGIDERRED